MTTREDFESYLMRLGVEYDEVDDGMWVIRGEQDTTSIVVSYSPPLAVMRLKIMDLPPGGDDARCVNLFRRLLELNATDIVHGSYGIEGDTGGVREPNRCSPTLYGKTAWAWLRTGKWVQADVRAALPDLDAQLARGELGGLLGETIKWNFTKFLLGRDGTVIKRYGSTTKPEKISADIEEALAA